MNKKSTFFVAIAAHIIAPVIVHSNMSISKPYDFLHFLVKKSLFVVVVVSINSSVLF